MKASVVVPVRDGADTIREQLEALAAQTFAGTWEVVVADNGSTDETRELVLSYLDRLPGLRVVDASGRSGAAHARNVGAAAAAGEVLAFCDADDVVDPRWLEALVESAATADLVGGRIESVVLNDSLARAWRPPLPDGALPLSHGWRPYALSANVAVRAEAFARLGGFREDYPVGEDVELSWRAQVEGLRLAFSPDAVVHYRYRSGLRPLLRQYVAYGTIGPRLYRDFRGHDMPGSPLRDALGPWTRLLASLPRAVVSRQERGDVLRRLAMRIGRLRGSLAVRVVYL